MFAILTKCKVNCNGTQPVYPKLVIVNGSSFHGNHKFQLPYKISQSLSHTQFSRTRDNYRHTRLVLFDVAPKKLIKMAIFNSNIERGKRPCLSTEQPFEFFTAIVILPNYLLSTQCLRLFWACRFRLHQQEARFQLFRKKRVGKVLNLFN